MKTLKWEIVYILSSRGRGENIEKYLWKVIRTIKNVFSVYKKEKKHT